MGTSWAKEVGRSLGEHYVRSKGRNLAQSEFLMQLNARMQMHTPKPAAVTAAEVEQVRRELEPVVVASVRESYPGFSPDRLT